MSRDKFKEEIIELLNHSGSIQGIIETASKQLGNPLAMFDITYNLLAHSENQVTDDPLWNELIKLGTFSHETVDFFNKEKFIELYAKSDCVSVLKSDKLKYDRANGKLFDSNDIQIGDISLVACFKPLEDEALELFELICEIASVELQNSELCTGIEQVYPKTLMNDLIDGLSIGKEELDEYYQTLNTGYPRNMYLAVVEVGAYEPTLTHLVYFKTVFEKMQREHKYFVHLNNIVILINTDMNTFSEKKHMKELKDFFTKYGIYAGVSGRISDISEVNKYYRQALHALNNGVKDNRGKQIYIYNDSSKTTLNQQ